MKEASKIIMGATLVMVVSLAVVLALILVLLAELYCSLLLRSRRKNSAAALPTTNQPSSASPVSSIYSHGVLRAPPNMLHHQYLSFSQSSPDQSPVLAPPLQIQIQLSPSSSTTDDQKNGSLMYISNPIFDKIGAAETPFETPETSPSRLESGGSSSSSSGEENQSDSPILVTAPVKKLREEACSLSLRDASLGTSVTDSNSRKVDSSSSSVSSATSTSW